MSSGASEPLHRSGIPTLRRPSLLRDGHLIAGTWRGLGSLDGHNTFSDSNYAGASDRQESDRRGTQTSDQTTLQVIDPCTSGIFVELPQADEKTADEAAEAAYQAFQTFKSTTVKERSVMLRRWGDALNANKEDLATIVVRENGKVWRDALGEVVASANYCYFFSDLIIAAQDTLIRSHYAERIIMSRKVPVGVCGIACPWNFPIMMMMRKVAAAIAAGCTVVVRPSSRSPVGTLSCAYLAEKDASFPPGVVNCVVGDNAEHAVSVRLCLHPKISKFSLTGSVPVGKHLTRLCASTLKKLSMELGGNAPFVVMADADLERTADGLMAAKLRCSGQTCIAPNVVYAHSSIYDALYDQIVDRMSKLKVAGGFDDGADVGPLIDAKAVERMEKLVQDCVAKGGIVGCGGVALPHLGKCFFAPTVLGGGTPDMMAVKEETFGPVLVFRKWDDGDALAEELAAATVGLAAYVYAASIDKGLTFAQNLQVGMVGLNCADISEPAMPFGGVKDSGYGREGSVFGLDEYTVLHSTAIQLRTGG